MSSRKIIRFICIVASNTNAAHRVAAVVVMCSMITEKETYRADRTTSAVQPGRPGRRANRVENHSCNRYKEKEGGDGDAMANVSAQVA